MDVRFTEMLLPFLPYLNGRQLDEHTQLRQGGLDSMQAIELMFAVEDTFGIQLADELLTEQTFSTAGSLWQAVLDSAPAGHSFTAEAV